MTGIAPRIQGATQTGAQIGRNKPATQTHSLLIATCAIGVKSLKWRKGAAISSGAAMVVLSLQLPPFDIGQRPLSLRVKMRLAPYVLRGVAFGGPARLSSFRLVSPPFGSPSLC